MRPVELELTVQKAVDAAQAGRSREDDRVEFKADWPDVSKARQLAGAANALRGETLIYIIGVANNGEVVQTSEQEPSDWHAAMAGAFDSDPPDLLLHRTVSVGEDGSDTVIALAFGTDRFPYVMTVKGEDRREVPLRVAAGTVSANRHQLLRILQPNLELPAMAVTAASVSVTWKDTPRPVTDTEPTQVERMLELTAQVRANIFVEYTGPRAATLPVRQMRARLRCGDLSTRLDVRVTHLGSTGFFTSLSDRPPEPIPPQYGVYAKDNHVIATAPGEFTINTSTDFPKRPAPDDFLSSAYEAFEASTELVLDFSLRVVGVDREVKLTAVLSRHEPVSTRPDRDGPHGATREVRLGRWEIPQIEDDPWGDGE